MPKRLVPTNPVTVYDLVQLAFLRSAGLPRGASSGPVVTGPEGLLASFALDIDHHAAIAAAGYRCTTCATLLGLCEHLARLLPGMSLQQAATLDSKGLLALHPEIPVARRDRATLAIEALQAALQAVRNQASTL